MSYIRLMIHYNVMLNNYLNVTGVMCVAVMRGWIYRL